MIGDLDTVGAETVANAIKKEGRYVTFGLESPFYDELMIFFPRRSASFIGCNVVKWEDQVVSFDLVIAECGAVDIVVGQIYFVRP